MNSTVDGRSPRVWPLVHASAGRNSSSPEIAFVTTLAYGRRGKQWLSGDHHPELSRANFAGNVYFTIRCLATSAVCRQTERVFM